MNYFASEDFFSLGAQDAEVTKSPDIVGRKLKLVPPDLGLTGCSQRAYSTFVMLSEYVLSTDLCYCLFKIFRRF